MGTLFFIIGLLCAFNDAYSWMAFWWALAYLFREKPAPRPRRQAWPYQVFGQHDDEWD